jgi:hypothetical protein
LHQQPQAGTLNWKKEQREEGDNEPVLVGIISSGQQRDLIQPPLSKESLNISLHQQYFTSIIPKATNILDFTIPQLQQHTTKSR